MTSNDIDPRAGQRVLPRFWFKEWRQQAGLTQKELAEVMGITKASISRIELGTRSFTADFLIDFQLAVGCPSIADPLLRSPFDFGGKPPERKRGEKRELPVFERARELRKHQRKQRENGRK